MYVKYMLLHVYIIHVLYIHVITCIYNTCYIAWDPALSKSSINAGILFLLGIKGNQGKPQKRF